eukprot:14959457-Heterocapsa_arctica.AAC.1
MDQTLRPVMFADGSDPPPIDKGGGVPSGSGNDKTPLVPGKVSGSAPAEKLITSNTYTGPKLWGPPPSK